MVNKSLPQLAIIDGSLALTSDFFSPIIVDFSPAAWKTRHAEGKKQGLIRACKPSKGIKIIDATAGRDAVLLASFGAKVIMLERNLTMAALLDDALKRQPMHPLDLSLITTDATDYFKTLALENFPDVIYIDPMHPERKKSALVKKDMQALQQLVKPDNDTASLITSAIQHTKNRVVVKWPQHAPAELKPDFSFPGKTVRFDVYLKKTYDSDTLS